MFALKTLILLTLALKALTLELDKNQTISIIAGIIDGVIKKDHLKELEACLNESEEITSQLQEIKEDLESKNINAMFEGLRLVGKLIISLPEQLEDCKDIKDDLA